MVRSVHEYYARHSIPIYGYSTGVVICLFSWSKHNLGERKLSYKYPALWKSIRKQMLTQKRFNQNLPRNRSSVSKLVLSDGLVFNGCNTWHHVSVVIVCKQTFLWLVLLISEQHIYICCYMYAVIYIYISIHIKKYHINHFKENIDSEMLSQALVATGWHRTWCWEQAITHVHFLWWTNGETRQNNTYAYCDCTSARLRRF